MTHSTPTLNVLPRALLALALSLAASPLAMALTNLKAVQVAGGSQVDLLFDGKLQKSQINVEYFNDVIQISLTEAAVYPAKISSVNGGELTKIFAYQYSPKLVRCRLSVKGKAEDFKGRFEAIANGKILTLKLTAGAVATAPVKLAPVSVKAAAAKAAPAKAASVHAIRVAETALAAPAGSSDEERALLDRVLHSQAAPAPEAAGAKPTAAESKAAARASKSAAAAESRAAKSAASDGADADEARPLTGKRAAGSSAGTDGPIATGKSPISPFKALGRIAIVLGLFGIVALGLRKFVAPSGLGAGSGRVLGRKETGIAGALSRFARKNLNRKARMIEVVSTHHLGPKKSIAVVRVAGRMLVLGVAADSITLITQLSAGAADSFTGIEDLEELGISMPDATPAVASGKPSRLTQVAAAAAPGMFADILGGETGRPAASSMAGMAGMAAPTYAPPAPTYSRPAPVAQAAPATGAGATMMGRHNLAAYGAAPVATTSPAAAEPQASLNGARARIRSRLEGLKPL